VVSFRAVRGDAELSLFEVGLPYSVRMVGYTSITFLRGSQLCAKHEFRKTRMRRHPALGEHRIAERVTSTGCES
jgi:hypothetical protein